MAFDPTVPNYWRQAGETLLRSFLTGQQLQQQREALKQEKERIALAKKQLDLAREASDFETMKFLYESTDIKNVGEAKKAAEDIREGRTPTQTQIMKTTRGAARGIPQMVQGPVHIPLEFQKPGEITLPPLMNADVEQYRAVYPEIAESLGDKFDAFIYFQHQYYQDHKEFNNYLNALRNSLNRTRGAAGTDNPDIMKLIQDAETKAQMAAVRLISGSGMVAEFDPDAYKLQLAAQHLDQMYNHFLVYKQNPEILIPVLRALAAEVNYAISEGRKGTLSVTVGTKELPAVIETIAYLAGIDPGSSKGKTFLDYIMDNNFVQTTEASKVTISPQETSQLITQTTASPPTVPLPITELERGRTKMSSRKRRQSTKATKKRQEKLQSTELPALFR